MEEKKIDLNEVIEVTKKIKEMIDVGIISINSYEVHMDEKVFSEVFKGREDVTRRIKPDGVFPYRYSVKEQGITFFCMSKVPLVDIPNGDTSIFNNVKIKMLEAANKTNLAVYNKDVDENRKFYGQIEAFADVLKEMGHGVIIGCRDKCAGHGETCTLITMILVDGEEVEFVE